MRWLLEAFRNTTFRIMIRFKLWRSNMRLQNIPIALVILPLLLPNQSWAGPSLKDIDMEYEFERPLKVVSKIHNGFRFEIVTPKESEKILGKDFYASNSSWYGDQYLIVWPPLNEAEDWPNEPVYIKRLKSHSVNFVNNGPLSENFVVIREWSGGGSCCFIIQAFQTEPKFKKLIEHNNDFFDETTIPVGEHEIELHKAPLSYPSSHVELKYNPRLFNLKTLEWKKF